MHNFDQRNYVTVARNGVNELQNEKYTMKVHRA